MIYIGINNGVSGSMGIITELDSFFYLMPVKKELSYTKKKQFVSRIDGVELKKILQRFILSPTIALERPMVNPGRFKATQSAMRALEAVLIVIELLEIPYRYIDSKEWQKVLLPIGLKGDVELKKASLDIGRRLFPQHANNFKKDADGMLIAEYLRRNNG